MRSPALALLALVVAPGILPAQTTFELWPGRTTFTSRGNIGGANTGETLQGIHASHNRGLGDNCAACVLPGFVAMLQDQNGASRESYHWVVRSGSDAKGPGAGSASVLGLLGPLQPPPSTSNSAVAWSLTTMTTKGVELKDCVSHFSIGVRFTPAPNWTRDGLSAHTSFGSAAFPHQGIHNRAEDHAWQIVGTATAASHPSNLRSWRHGIVLEHAALQLGNGGALYGMGGMFPKADAPVSARIQYGANMVGGSSLLYMSSGVTSGFMLLPMTVRFYLGGRFYRLGSLPIGGRDGQVIHTITSKLPAACAGSPRHYFQAVGIKNGVFRMTNAQAVNP